MAKHKAIFGLVYFVFIFFLIEYGHIMAFLTYAHQIPQNALVQFRLSIVLYLIVLAIFKINSYCITVNVIIKELT